VSSDSPDVPTPNGDQEVNNNQDPTLTRVHGIPTMKPILPDIVWEEKPRSPKDFIQPSFQGPEVVRLERGGGGYVSFGPLIDPTRPFLIFSHRRRTKAYAEPVFDDGIQPKTSHCFEIPKDYIGWFERIPPEDSEDMSDVAALQSIAEISASGCKYFLLRSVLAGFKVQEIATPDGEDIILLEECKFYPGELFQVVSVCTKIWKSRPSTRTKGVTQIGTKYLKCLDMNRNVFCLPLAHPGMFSSIHKMYTEDDPNAVHQIWHLLDHDKIPRTVKLTFGWAPPMKDGEQFTGKLKITEVTRPDTLLCYNFTDEGIIMIELPINANIQVYRAQNCDELSNCDAFANAMSSCKRKVFQFAICMKPLDQPYERDDGQQKYMASPRDMQDQICSQADVFPAQEVEEPLSEFWTFSFKDPEMVHQTLRMHVQSSGESGDDISTGALSNLSSRLSLHDSQINGHDNGSRSSKGSAQSRDSGKGVVGDRRRAGLKKDAFQESSFREAQC